MNSPTVPCWVEKPFLLLETLQPSIVRSVNLLNQNLPKDTPWHTGSMTTAARANILLGNTQRKPWQAQSAEEYLSKLRAIFVPHIVDEVTEQVINHDKMGRGAKKPYNLAAFTEQILISALSRVEETHASATKLRKQLRLRSESYKLPATLEHRKVPSWVKNPILLHSGCRGLAVQILKEINKDMPIDSDWWRDEYLSTADRVRTVARRIKRLFHWHIDEPDEKFLPRLPFQGEPGTFIDEPIRETWAGTPHKTATLVGSVFRRHVAVQIKHDAMQFEYTLPGISTKDKKRLSKRFWDMIRRTLLEVVQHCETVNTMEDEKDDLLHDGTPSSRPAAGEQAENRKKSPDLAPTGLTRERLRDRLHIKSRQILG
ncbi:hypothetical protein DL769_006550 [Monosporascus sp. CRB-8-3]|nr:hypothetical protein DL769_006550 [Monosporascus sp. CRB-8-3]